jgi:hypothetical protein
MVVQIPSQSLLSNHPTAEKKETTSKLANIQKGFVFFFNCKAMVALSGKFTK